MARVACSGVCSAWCVSVSLHRPTPGPGSSNTGVWLMKARNASAAYLEEWWAVPDTEKKVENSKRDHPWEQRAWNEVSTVCVRVCAVCVCVCVCHDALACIACMHASCVQCPYACSCMRSDKL